MQWRIVVAYSLILVLLITVNAKAQLPLHYYIDHSGKVQLLQITGEPYAAGFYRQNNPLATLKLTKEDSSIKVIASQYTFDRDFQKLRTKPSHIDTLPRDAYDFSYNTPIARNYFTDAYPFWQDYNNKLFTANIQNGKYDYEYSYVHYSPARDNSLPHPAPSNVIPRSYTPISVQWHLDGNYKTSTIKQQIKDSATALIDSVLYEYAYAGNGLIRKVVCRTPIRANNTMYKREVYFFYNEINKLAYVISVTNNRQEIDEAYCKALLDTMKARENIHQYIYYQDTPKIFYFVAYNYDTKGRFSSAINYDLREGKTSLMVDSVTYNGNNLPDTIDQYTYKRKDEYGSRTIIIYDKQGKALETVENKYRQWFRNPKSPVASLRQNKFTYDSKGRIASVSIFFDKHIDTKQTFEYIPK